MLGAIIGDMAGTLYEYKEFMNTKNGRIDVEGRKRVLSSEVELIPEKAFISDDSLLTIAVADSITSDREYRDVLKEYGRKYGGMKIDKEDFFERPFSYAFTKWSRSDSNENGTSIGNGAAMRVSPVGFLFDNLAEVQEEAKKSAVPSHDSENAIVGAQSIASGIFLARQGFKKSEIKEYLINRFNLNLDFDLENLRETNTYIGTGKETAEHAIFAFLESDNFEDSIRKAISIGGDTDTIACMNGGIAEAYYGIPKDLRDKALKHIPQELIKVVEKEYQYRIDKNKGLLHKGIER